MCLLDLVIEVGLEQKLVASTNGGEYHSSCPKCGGDDRFFIQPNRKMKNCYGSYCCRKCGISGDSIQFCRDICGLSFKDAVDRVQAIVPERSYSLYQSKKTNRHNHAKLKRSSKTWTSRANAFVEKAHEQILQELSILEYLESRGLNLEAVKKYKIGWNQIDFWNEKSDWGIDDEPGKRVWLPRGIVIPSIDPSGNVIRLKIRRYDWKEGDKFPKYVAISGGMNGLNIIGNTKKKLMIVVESEFDAYALHNVVNDFAVVIAVGSNIKNPDNLINSLAKKVSNIFICHDNDDAGKAMLDKWKSFYSNAQSCPTPIGKDIGEAIQQGLDLKAWIIAKVPPQMKYHLNLIQRSWSEEDKALIDWFLNEKKLPLTPFVLSAKEHGIEEVGDPSYYEVLRAAIKGGHDSWQAKTGRLQEILRLLKMLIKQNNSK